MYKKRFFKTKNCGTFPFRSLKNIFPILATELSSVNLNAGAHSGSNNAALYVLTLSSCRSCLDNSAHEGVEVFFEFFNAEGSLTDGAVDDVGLVKTVFDLTCFRFFNSLSNVHGNGTCLGVRHKALRTEKLTETADNTHHVGSCDNNVEIEPVFGLDLLNHVDVANVVSACCSCEVSLFALSENEGSYSLTGTVGKYDCTTNLLVSVTAVNAESDVNFDGFIEFRLGSLANEADCFVCIVKFRSIDELCALLILFTLKHFSYSSSKNYSVTVIPMLRAVPATMLIAASTEAALRSGILVSAIF